MGAKRLGGKRPGGKRLGGETTRGGNGLGAKRPGFIGDTYFSFHSSEFCVYWSSLDFNGHVGFFADILAMSLIAISQYLKLSGGGGGVPAATSSASRAAVDGKLKHKANAFLWIASSFFISVWGPLNWKSPVTKTHDQIELFLSINTGTIKF